MLQLAPVHHLECPKVCSTSERHWTPCSPTACHLHPACRQPAAVWVTQLEAGCLQPLLPAEEWCLHCAGRSTSSETAARRRTRCRLWRGGGPLCQLMSEESFWGKRLCLAPRRCRWACSRHWHPALTSSRGRCSRGNQLQLVKPQLQGGPPLLTHVAMSWSELGGLQDRMLRGALQLQVGCCAACIQKRHGSRVFAGAADACGDMSLAALCAPVCQAKQQAVC